MQEIKLTPCPFCKKVPNVWEARECQWRGEIMMWVGCQNTSCVCKPRFLTKNAGTAIAVWNTLLDTERYEWHDAIGSTAVYPDSNYFVLVELMLDGSYRLQVEAFYDADKQKWYWRNFRNGKIEPLLDSKKSGGFVSGWRKLYRR